jgi:hypothetical protein
MNKAQRERLISALESDNSDIVQIHYLKGGQISKDTLTIVEEFNEEFHRHVWQRIRRVRTFNADGIIELENKYVIQSPPPPFHDEPKTWTELENERMEKRGIR